jgi:cell division protein FtsI/penicillin-binding protein 2
MARRLQLQRLLWLALLLCLAFAGLGYRLVDLQVLRHEEFVAKAKGNTEREFLFEPRRGDILDARGTILASTILTKQICADPESLYGHQAEIARLVGPLLGIDEAKLNRLLTPSVRRNSKGETKATRFVPLKRRVPVETWNKIQVAMTNFSIALTDTNLTKQDRAALRAGGIFARDDQKRVYPNKTLASHVLGFTNPEETEVDDFLVTEIVGKEGIEKTFNDQLKGIRGWRVTETDHRAREIVAYREQDVRPHEGMNVVLTIDSGIQAIVESELADAMAKHTPISVSCVVLRPKSGEVLAMATLPNFDPNDILRSTDDSRRNRPITDIAEPGSTFKIVVVSGALNDKVVSPEERVDCEHGHWAFAGRTLHDHEAEGVLSVEGVITRSSNIGAGKIGVKMGETRLYDYIRSYGFGTRTGIPLPAEVPGIVHPVKKWSKVSIAQIPMGHGVCVTRLQMAMAMCAIANNGVLMRPMLVDRLEDAEHNTIAKYVPQTVRRVISESTAKQMVKALKTVVTPEGTAPKAALEHYTVAGKTGTATKVENGFYVKKYFSSFIGFFPADNPELCISVTFDEPKQSTGYYGGHVAAPVFKRIAERAANYLNLRPEDSTTPDHIAAPTEPRPLKTASTGTP